MGYKEDIGLKIRVMRKSRGMTQEDLAKAIDQSPSSITMYETGRREPNFETLEAIADVFNVSLYDFIPIAQTDEDFAYDPEDFLNREALKAKNDNVRLLINGANRMSQEDIDQLTDVMRVMFAKKYPDLFEKGTEDHDA